MQSGVVVFDYLLKPDQKFIIKKSSVMLGETGAQSN